MNYLYKDDLDYLEYLHKLTEANEWSSDGNKEEAEYWISDIHLNRIARIDENVKHKIATVDLISEGIGSLPKLIEEVRYYREKYKDEYLSYLKKLELLK